MARTPTFDLGDLDWSEWLAIVEASHLRDEFLDQQYFWFFSGVESAFWSVEPCSHVVGNQACVDCKHGTHQECSVACGVPNLRIVSCLLFKFVAQEILQRNPVLLDVVQCLWAGWVYKLRVPRSDASISKNPNLEP